MNLDRTREQNAGAGTLPEPAVIAGFEPMYSPRQIAEWLGCDESAVRRWFAGVEGVLKLNSPSSDTKTGKRHYTIRVPKSVLEAFVRERSR